MAAKALLGVQEESMSFDLGMMLHERDRRRATHLFKRTPSLSKSSSMEGEQIQLGQWEPDWSKFESIYARGKYTGAHALSTLPILFLNCYSKRR